MKSSRSSNQPAVAKLEALSLSALSEEERLSAVAEIRVQMALASEKKSADQTVLVRKLALLKIWQKLVQLRVSDVQKDKAPPTVKPLVDRMFPEEPEPQAQEHVVDTLAEAPAPELAPTKKRKGAATVPVKLIEEAVIKGKTVAAGVVVEVSRKEANGLVESGKGTISD